MRGFTLVEMLFGVFLFVIVSTAVYSGYMSVMNLVKSSNTKIAAADLANEQFEIVRNLPYADVGIVNGVPAGKVPYTQTLTRSGYTFTVIATVRNVDLPFDGTIGGAPNDLSPADNKLVEFEVLCGSCKNFLPVKFTSHIAPKNLETASTNGALFIRVFDANGVAISGASVRVQSVSGIPAVDINDVTNAQGMLQIVDIVPALERYKVTVSKENHSTETTYLTGAPGNPNPTAPHATVVLQQVTQKSFAIDRTSTVFVSSVTDTCFPVADVDFHLTGSKKIGTNPDIYKYDTDQITDNNGAKTLGSLEWDTYTLTLTDTSQDLIGSSPLLPLSLNPNATQNLQLVVAPKNARTLMVSVKDSATSLPLSGASVTLTGASYNNTLITGRGFLTQTNWSGGGGQANFVDTARYFDSDGNVETNNPAGVLTLKQVFGSYVLSGSLTSSTFDSGSVSNFYNITWQPTDQPPVSGADSVRLHIASGNDQATTTWNFLGPDGTAGSYYTTSNSNINAVHNGDRFIRYKVFLQTASPTVTPTISDVSFTFTSQCTPPGQVVFGGLLSGTYNLTVSKTGYQTATVEDINIGSPWQQQSITLIPQ